MSQGLQDVHSQEAYYSMCLWWERFSGDIETKRKAVCKEGEKEPKGNALPFST